MRDLRHGRDELLHPELEPWVEPPNHDPPGPPASGSAAPPLPNRSGTQRGHVKPGPKEPCPIKLCGSRSVLSGNNQNESTANPKGYAQDCRSPLPEELKSRPTSSSLGTPNHYIVKRGCVYVTKKEAKAKIGENSSRKQIKAEGEEENGQDVSSRRVVPETQTGPAPYNLSRHLGTLRCFCFKEFRRNF
ncbi:hypothetical protein CNYM01_03411 [Colletotrichum nymphaeae SA-01]|uniref:Uncharacterized protein n=1 Tax=Colletotrichum nymphaeae SA-01 TaxID=1460502 RepID=A0A135U3N7_9PEZI|nr:hypothetical protein CNYM01_03411 [Colletotrichum nymphaeae SA-01]